jgi:hypothetical protein
LRVLSIENINGVAVVDAVVHGWNSQSAVRFPLDLVNEAERGRVQVGETLSALTNLRAENQVDLYFEDVKIAPLPDPEDGLG